MPFPKALLGFLADLVEPLFPVLARRGSPAQEREAEALAAGQPARAAAAPALFQEALTVSQIVRMTTSTPLSFAGDTLECRSRTTVVVLTLAGERRTYLLPAGAKIRFVAGMILIPPWEVEEA